MVIEYRGIKIPEKYFSDGCTIIHRSKKGISKRTNFKPNGTGGESTHWIIKLFLRNLPSDKYQIEGSNPHDLLFEIGGDLEDMKAANKIMKKFAIAAVKRVHKFYSPLRYFFILRMRQNFTIVDFIGEDHFNFNQDEFFLLPIIVIT